MTRDNPEVLRSSARLEALRRTALLDSPAEESFDRLTRLAATALRVPMALISLLTGDRQFIKSQTGLSGPLATMREMSLDGSFCQHAVTAGEPLVVADARSHPVFSGYPAVRELGVVAYAGIPLITSEGHALGTISVLDGKPHHWTENEIGILQVLATSTMSEIELRSLVESRTAELRASEERQRVLLDINNTIVTCLDRDSLFAATMAALRHIVPFDRAALVLHDPVKDVFRVLGVARPEPSLPGIPLGKEWPRQNSRAGWVLEQIGRAHV